MESKIIKYGNHKITNDNDGYMYSFNTSQSYTFNSHLHKCYEFVHIIHGQLLYTVEGTDYMLSDGDVIMTNPVELHSFSFPKECGYQREFLHIYPGFLNQFPEIISQLNSRKSGYFNCIPAKLADKYGIDVIFRGIEKYCKNPVVETDFMVLTYTLQLAAIIKQILREETEDCEKKSFSDKKTNSISLYIDRHYRENITVDTIANATFMSSGYASRIFKKETGITIKAYLNFRRITHAKNLIMQGEKATTIFADCGFSDYSTFYRSFVKYVGMTPDEFKHTHNL